MSAVKKQKFRVVSLDETSNDCQQSDEQPTKTMVGSWMTALPGGAVVVQSDGKVGECNAQALDMLGAPLLHESWEKVIHRAFVPRADDGHEVSLRDGRKVRIDIQPLPGRKGQLIQLIDLTESRIWQDRVAHQQRVNALGRMAASLAHQLRTPLSSATLYAAHLQRPELDEGLRVRFATQVAQQLQVMEGQIRALLLLARQELPLTDRIDIAAWAEEWRQRLVTRPKVSLEFDPALKSLVLMGHRLALDEAINNLLRNAEEVVSVTQRVVVRFQWDKDQLWIRITDQGGGMTPEVLRCIEQPFYTTKTQGTGLGLALVRTILSAHSGFLDVVSQYGLGSTFSLVLPVHKEVAV